VKALAARLLACGAALLLAALSAQAGGDPLDEPPEGDRPPPPPARRGEVTPPARFVEKGTILFATDDSYPPMEFWDHGRIRGLDIDVAKAVAKLLGLDPEFVSTEFQDLLPAVKSGRVDAAISSIDVTEKRAEVVAFVPYMTLRQVFVGRPGGVSVTALAGLKGKRVAVQQGTTSESLAREHAGPDGVTAVATFEKAFEELRKGAVDVVLVDEPVAAHKARLEPASFAVAGPATKGEPIGIALPRDDAALQAAVREAITKLTERGELAKITARWLTPRPVEKPADPRAPDAKPGTPKSFAPKQMQQRAPPTAAPPKAAPPPPVPRPFPATDPWNQDVSRAKVHPRSAAYVASIGADKPLHPDFGTVWNGAPNGIPYCVVGKGAARAPVTFEYADESDPGPYPIPEDAPIEGGPEGTGDRHVIVIDLFERRLYELFSARKDGKGGWTAGSGAVFDLVKGTTRPAGWTSADAAGLPIFPGLVRYDEAVTAGRIDHALRVTVARTQRGYVAPARHFASKETDPDLPPMGLRLRLKAGFDTSRFPPAARAILTALQRYGMLVADNGSDWFISGAPDARWKDDDLATLKRVKGSDLEALDTGPVTTK